MARVESNQGAGAGSRVTCDACGDKVAAYDAVIGINGRVRCTTCHAAGGQTPSGEPESVRVETEDAESPPEPAPALVYQCCGCRRRFPADAVYNDNGSITCVACYDRMHIGVASESRAAANEADHRQGEGTSPTLAAAPAEAAPAHLALGFRPSLLARVTCPHCWQRFIPQEVLWVARHAELRGDTLLGPDAPMRFLPSQFNAECAAVDARGMACQTLACPGCHLVIPRALLEAEPLFASIVGVAASGKSYFLTAMTWALRQLLPMRFAVGFNDTDALTNRPLNLNEQTLFLADDGERPVRLDKTDVVGSLLYDQIHLGQQVVSLPRPFLFTMRPTGRHPYAGDAQAHARVVCLYDNAGEHFEPGEDTASSPVTQHLGRSRALMFLFDPTQDPRFRARCRGLSNDPQLDGATPTRRQETVLLETIARVRQYAGLAPSRKVGQPLMIVVPKADVWGPLCGLDLSREPIMPGGVMDGLLDAVDVGRIEGVSAIVREMLMDTAPEFVLAAEEFASNVMYVPVSALGGSPEMRPGSDGLWIRPSQIKPRWVTAPFLYMFARWSHDLIGGVRGWNGEEKTPQTINATDEHR